MSDKIMDTQELGEIRRLIGDIEEEQPVAKPAPAPQPVQAQPAPQ